jgi:hypothetical protein
MGVFSDHFGEPLFITNGLPELVKYWLTVNLYTPKGDLVNRLEGKNLKNLSSETWDRYYHPGYFLIIDIDFWFRPEVQNFVMTILRVGRDIEGRWSEQMIHNFVRMIFIPNENVWIMNEVDIGHDRFQKSSFENWCVKTGIYKDPY